MVVVGTVEVVVVVEVEVEVELVDVDEVEDVEDVEGGLVVVVAGGAELVAHAERTTGTTARASSCRPRRRHRPARGPLT